MFNYDITSAAEVFAGTAGLLGGFAITVMFLLVERMLDETGDNPVADNYQQALALIMLVTIMNIGCAYCWGIIIGEPLEGVRPYLLHFVVVTVFALSTVLIVEVVVLILPLHRLQKIFPLTKYVALVAVLGFGLTTYGYGIDALRAYMDAPDYLMVMTRYRPSLIPIALIVMGIPLAGFILHITGVETRINVRTWPSFMTFCVVTVVWIGVLLAVVFPIVRYLPAGNTLTPLGFAALTGTWGLLATWSLFFMPSKAT